MIFYSCCTPQTKMTAFTVLIIITICWEVSTETRCPNHEDFQNISIARPVVKLESSNICYWAFDQGPCRSGEWFRFHEALASSNFTRLGFCQQRLCPEIVENDQNALYPQFSFEHNGNCYQTLTVNWEFCGSNTTVVTFTEDDDVPTCRESSVTEGPDGRGIFTPLINWGPIKSMRRGYLFN